MTSFNLDLFAAKTFKHCRFHGGDNNLYLRIKETHYVFHISVKVTKQRDLPPFSKQSNGQISAL